MSAVASVSEFTANTSNGSQLTNISVNARIDYILRFNKQTIAVVGENSEHYASVCSQFLAGLSAEHNAAYIAVGSQLQDIQIRSRIIDQLFANVLFDPEQSLALTLINLTKNQPQKLAIAIENGQYLSIQILHELVQLAEVAKKLQLAIDIVIVGDQQLGLLLTENSILFKNKLSLLSAQTGQLLAFNSALFKLKKQWLTKLSAKNITILLSIILLLVFVIAGFYYFFNNYTIKTSPLNHLQPVNASAMKQDTFVTATLAKNNTTPQQLVAAQPVDILNAIELSARMPAQIESATVKDVLEALERINKQANIIEEKTPNLADVLLPQAKSDYLSHQQGFVIQYAAFSDEQVKKQFLQRFPDLEYLSYYRNVDNKTFEVITSQVFSERTKAQQALAALPSELIALKIWIKSLAAVKNEISEYQGSQS